MLAANHHAIVAFRRAKSVVVCGHVRPDGDAVGSVLGLTLALRDNGIAAVPTLADDESAAPDTYGWLPGFGLYVAASQLEVPDVFVALDTPNLDRLGVAGELASKAATLIVMDHHPDATEYGHISVLDPTAAATSQLVWRLIKELDSPPAAETALCCYVGLITDTGRFSYQNTSAAALTEAAEMIEAGVDPSDASRRVYQSRSAGALALECRVMSRLSTVNDGCVAYSWLSEDDLAETGARREETEPLPDAIRELRGVEVVALITQAGSEFRVNLRAKSDADVGSVARFFGGGGHKAASGFTWTGASLQELLGELLPLLPGGASE